MRLCDCHCWACPNNCKRMTLKHYVCFKRISVGSYIRLMGSLAQVPPWCPPNSGVANIRCPPRMIYLRSRLGRAMPAIGRDCQVPIPPPQGSRGPQFSLLRRQLWTTLPWGSLGTKMPPASRWLALWGTDKGVEPTGQGAPVFPWVRTWTSLTFVPTPSKSQGRQDELQLDTLLLYAALDYLLCIVGLRFVQASVRVDYLL